MQLKTQNSNKQARLFASFNGEIYLPSRAARGSIFKRESRFINQVPLARESNSTRLQSRVDFAKFASGAKTRTQTRVAKSVSFACRRLSKQSVRAAQRSSAPSSARRSHAHKRRKCFVFFRLFSFLMRHRNEHNSAAIR